MRAQTVVLALLLGGALALDAPATAQKPKTPLHYSHSLHTKNGVSQKDCSKCHELDNKFVVKPPTSGKPHQPCATSGCHGDEFFSTEPTICVVCHDDAKPWIKQTARIRDRRDSEFGGDLSHATHATGRVGGAGANGACTTCHGDKFRDETATGTGGHADCAPCHARDEQPRMSSCGGCHRLGAKKARVAARDSEWSVAALFAHTTHGNDPRPGQGETSCTTCHQQIKKARTLAEVKNPTMKSCDGCHDGKLAFKTTGFQCYRCHSEEAGRPR